MPKALPRFALAALVVAALSAGCALRPRYSDLMHAQDVQGRDTAAFVLVERGTQKPIPGAQVTVQVGRERVKAKTDEQGRFELPVKEQWTKENPLVVVETPNGTGAYDALPAPAAVSEPAPAAAEPAPEPAAQEASPFEGCTITALNAQSRLLRCDGIVAAVNVSAGDADEDTVLKATVAGLKVALGAEMDVVEDTVDLLGAPRKMVRVQATRMGGEGKVPVAHGVVVAVPQDGGQMRTASCMIVRGPEDAEQRCTRMLEALAKASPDPTEGQAPAPESQEGPPVLRGKELTVPQGCQAERRRIVCDQTALVWREDDRDSSVPLDALSEPMKAAFASMGTVQESALPCTVAGGDAECRAYRVQKKDGGAFTAILGLSTAEGARVVIECDVMGDLPKAAPPPCDQVLGFK